MYTNTLLDKINGPIRVIYEPTIHCNLRCPMCDRTHKSEYENHKKRQLTTEQSISFLEDVIALGATNIQLIGGGEPLMRSDIITIIECIKKHNVNLHLWTNGTLITEKNAEFLASHCDIITVSLDSTHDEINDMLRGMEGATQKSIMGLRLLRNSNPNVYLRIHSVLSAHNILHLNDFLPLIDEIKINEIGGAMVNPFPFVPSDFLISNENKQIYDDMIVGFCEEIKRRRITLAGCYASISKRIISDIEKTVSMTEKTDSHITCLGLWSQATVRPNGDVSICCFSYKPVLGNLHDGSFSDIWHSKKAETLRKLVFEGEYLDAPCYGCDLGNPVFTKLLNLGKDMTQFNYMINTSR